MIAIGSLPGAVNYGACLVDEDSKNAQARAEAKAALEAKHTDEWREFEERAEAKEQVQGRRN